MAIGLESDDLSIRVSDDVKINIMTEAGIKAFFGETEEIDEALRIMVYDPSCEQTVYVTVLKSGEWVVKATNAVQTFERC